MSAMSIEINDLFFTKKASSLLGSCMIKALRIMNELTITSGIKSINAPVIAVKFLCQICILIHGN